MGADLQGCPTSLWQRLGLKAMLLTHGSAIAMVMLHILFCFLKNFLPYAEAVAGSFDWTYTVFW